MLQRILTEPSSSRAQWDHVFAEASRSLTISRNVPVLSLIPMSYCGNLRSNLSVTAPAR